MQTSQNGLILIKHYEGCRLEAYPDPASNGEPYTIGVGHTGTVDGIKVHLGMKITQEKADQLLKNSVKNFESGILKLVKVPITQNQFDALVSFTFNLGVGALQKSTLLKYINSKQFLLASQEFIKWNKGGGKVMNGLTCRRMSERDLFSTGKLVLYRYDNKTKKIVKI